MYVELSIHSDVTFRTPPVDPLRRPVEGREPVWRFLRELRPGYALMLLGAPGSGKTTLLHHLLLTYARGRQWRFRARRRVPAFLEFRSLAAHITGNPDFSLANALRHQIKAHFADLEKALPVGWVERRLRHGGMILLFDGLDEVASPEARGAVSVWLERHLTAEASRANLFLATSRPSGYLDAPLERARVLQVEPFSAEQSRRFIQCWYLQNEIVSSGLKETDAVRRRAEEAAGDLLRRLGENPNLYDLSANPLLLTMLCMVHRYHGALPGSRSQLYAEICQVLLERWRQARGVTDAEGLRGEQKLSVLRPLAEAYMLAGRREIQDREILPLIESHLQAVGYTKEPLEFLRVIQAGSGLLLEKEAGVWAWAHKTFQEYLTAEYWLQRPEEARDWPRFVADEWWREAVLLYAAKADASAPLSAALATESPAAWSLAWQLLAEASRLDPGTRTSTEERLHEALRSRDPIRFLPAARAHHDLRMREWTPTADGVCCRKTPVSNAEYQLFLLQRKPVKRWPLVPPHWREDWFRGEPEDPILGVFPWQAERLVESLQGNDDRVVTALPHETNELSPNVANFPIWSQRWNLLFLNKPPAPNLVLATPQHSMLRFSFTLTLALTRDRSRDLALVLDLDLDRALDLDRYVGVGEIRRTQFDFRATLINYLKATLPTIRSRSRPDLQLLIERLQLLNDRLEGWAEPVEAIALVRRERARK